jgi:C_GCAxxG_C_C family probable redox protein
MQKNLTQEALSLFKQGASCSQSILATYGPLVGLSLEQSFQVGSGLGGGIGRKQYVCGAINAGAIILGLKFGNKALGDIERKELTSKITGAFVSDCEMELGNSQCSELLKVDISNPEERERAKENGLLDRVCNNAVLKTAQLLEIYLKEKY